MTFAIEPDTGARAGAAHRSRSLAGATGLAEE